MDFFGFRNSHLSESDTSYTTISEHDTSDTSMNVSSNSSMSFTEEISVISVESSSEEELSIDESHSSSESDSEFSCSLDDSDVTSSLFESSGISSDTHDVDSTSTLMSDVVNIARSFETGYTEVQNILASQVTAHMASDSDNEWDVTTSSLGVPEEFSRSSISLLINRIGNLISPRKKMNEEKQMANIRQQAFRERSWTLEECSICFDVMLRNQDVTSLPCAHNFHTDCIMPWLQEKQTCPNCRKVAE